MTVLILAAGEGTRWSAGNPKQLLPFHQEPLLCRTIRQVRQRGADPIVVAVDPLLHAVSENNFSPAKRRWTTETLLSTKEFFTSRN